jgi:hypothetical protein
LLDPLREDFRAPLRDDLREPFRGTLAPFSRASLSPIAIACLRLVTRFPDRPLFSVPRFFRRIADSTLFEADFPYFAMHYLRSEMPARCVLDMVEVPRTEDASERSEASHANGASRRSGSRESV